MKIDSQKILFTHIPRTGGSTIERILFDAFVLPDFIKNYNFDQYVDFFPDLLHNFKKSKKPNSEKYEFGKKHFQTKGLQQNRQAQLFNPTAFLGWNQVIKKHTQHLTSLEMKAILKESWTEYFKFSFVRNPWDRCVSDWLWLCNEFNMSNKENSLKNYILCKGFFSKINNFNDIKGRADHFYTQSEFVLNKDGESIVDFIGRFENLTSDINFLCQKFGIENPQIMHLNKNKRRHYRDYYNDETRDLVSEKYSQDILNFKYNF